MSTDTATVPHVTAPEITLDLLFGLLDCDPSDGLAKLVHNARVAHYTLPALVLSVLENEGVDLGITAGAELRRARHRAARYAGVLADLPDDGEVVPLKGPSLAQLYPPGVLRSQGDVDLLARDESRLWQTVTRLAADESSQIWVTVMGAEPAWNVLVTMVWQTDEPIVDHEYRVELTTAALLGDFDRVRVRTTLPTDPVLAALVCLTEEGLQRPFHPRDALDLYVLQPRLPAAADIAAVVEEFHLAPELLGLGRYTSRVLPQCDVAELMRVLAEPARRELDRRENLPAAVAPVELRDVVRCGQPAQGLLLRRRIRTDLATARTHWSGDQAVLHTPVGDYLLVAGKLVAEEDFESALTVLRTCDESAAC
ncbi:hypothetical protein [Streptomyces nodosus]|uniref:hypothetical protein n=1 Tax=Streptomyces nodosus TaxID=40318 RepID=UPI0037FAC043